MKKSAVLFITVFALIAAMVLSACGSANPPAAPTSAPQKTEPTVAAKVEPTTAPAQAAFDLKGKKIGYIYLTLAHPYYQAHQAHTREYAKQLGIDLVEYDGKADAAVMTNAMEDLIAQKVDGIVFALLDPAAAVPSINEAQKAGIPVVTFAIKHGDGAKAPFVGIPEGQATEEAGKLAAARFVKQFGADKQAYVATVECPSIQAIVDRADGFIKGFTETMPNAKVVARTDGNCVRDKALAAAEDLLQSHPEVNVLYGGNGDSSLGALAALQGAGRGKAGDVLLVSHDGTEPEIKELVNPDSGLKLSIANRPRELAEATIDTLAEVMAGKRAVTSTDDVLVGAQVLVPDDTALLQKFLTEEYLSNLKLDTTQKPAQAAFDLKGKKIGYIYLTLAHPYYQAHQAHTREYAKQLGIDLVEYDGKADAAVMTNAMEDLIAQKVDGIVFALLDPAAAVPSINEAQKAGIPVVTFAIKHGDGAKAPFVGIPEGQATEEAGKLAAARFVKQFGADKQAYVATVECPSIQAIVDRADGFIKGFTETMPNAKVVARTDGNCVRDKALAAAEDLLQSHPEVNVLYGGNGDSSLGALAALQGAGRGKAGDVLLVSHDGTEPEIKELVNPDSGLKLSIANRPRELAEATIDTLAEVMAGKRAMTSTDDVLVGAQVLQPDDTALLQKFLTEEYLSNLKLK